MSSLLKEAIVDAAALKEAALKNAESSIIDKYSVEVREAVNRILEQDDLDLSMGGELGAPEEAAEEPEPELDMGAEPGGEDASAPAEEIVDSDDVPLAALDDFDKLEGDGLAGSLSDGEKVEFNLDLGSLQEAIKDLRTTLEETAELEFEMSDLEEILCETTDQDLEEDMEVGASAGVQSGDEAEAEEDEFEGSDEGGLDEDLDTDALLDAVMERLTVDMGATLSGWAGRSSESQKWEMEKALAQRRSTDIQDELEVLRKAQEELVFENKQLKEHLSQYKEATTQLKEGLQDVNLSNARLLYTNRVLRNTSLNERQKETIVEAISRAGSVTEARTIFDTLQSTAQATPKKSPQSLSEAITRRSSVIRASRHSEKPSSDPLQDRMKRLAGIK